MPHTDYYLVKRALTGRDNECGDTGVIFESSDNVFFALVDVLGHGGQAHEVAILAEQYLEANHRDDLIDLMKGLHECLKGSRGAVAAVCRLHLADGELRCVGMGNITVRILGPRGSRFVLRDGILGYMIPSFREERAQLSSGDVVVMYSDGVRGHFDAIEYPWLLTDSARTVASNMVQQFGKDDDDASCIALKYLK